MNVINLFKTLPDPTPVYRSIKVNSLKDIDYDNLGNSWSFEKQSAINFADNQAYGNVLISGFVKKRDVDWNKTIENYFKFSRTFSTYDEDEIKIPNAEDDVFDIEVEKIKRTDSIEETRKIVREVLIENLQLADKVYFNNGLLSQRVREIITSKITKGDVFTKLISDIYYKELQQQLKVGDWSIHGLGGEKGEYKEKDVYTTKDDVMSLKKWKEIKSLYNDLKTYNKNIFPIKGFNINGVEDIWSLITALKKRRVILEKFKTLPSVAWRNMKSDIRIERDGLEMNNYKSDIEYFISNYSLLNNRNKELKKVVERKMFKSGVTLKELIDFVEEKENLLGGIDFNKEKIKDITEDSNELEIIYEKGNIIVVEVGGPYGIKEIGCNSLWCFTYGEGWSKEWGNYSYNDTVYAIIDFNKLFDSPYFMHVIIKPLIWNPENEKEEEMNDETIFDMSNENIFNALHFLESTIGIETAKKLLTFYVEQEEKIEDEEEEFVNQNQLSLFEARKVVREVLIENFEKTIIAYHTSESDFDGFNSTEYIGNFATILDGSYFLNKTEHLGNFGKFGFVYKVEIKPKKLFKFNLKTEDYWFLATEFQELFVESLAGISNYLDEFFEAQNLIAEEVDCIELKNLDYTDDKDVVEYIVLDDKIINIISKTKIG